MRHFAVLFICLPLLNILSTSDQVTGNMTVSNETLSNPNSTRTINISSSITNITSSATVNSTAANTHSQTFLPTTHSPVHANSTTANSTMATGTMVTSIMAISTYTTNTYTTNRKPTSPNSSKAPIGGASAKCDHFVLLLISLMFGVLLVTAIL